MTRPLVGRFAPSPTGRIHAGNIFASLVAWLIAKSTGGTMVLRIEDLDQDRSKQRYIDCVQRDFEALGLTWDAGPFFQSSRTEAYAEALRRLQQSCETYLCFCTRADLSSVSAPHWGDKHVYPGTCAALSPKEAQRRKDSGEASALRCRVPHQRIGFLDLIQGPYEQTLDEDCGDFIVRRKDGAFAYQLAVVVDDAAQGITSVTRGIDLLSSTPQQMFLQRMLGYESPSYAHVPLLVSSAGRRLSKRDRDASLDEMLVRFGTPEGVIGHIAFVTGLQKNDDPVTPEELLKGFTVEALASSYRDAVSIPWS